jgi:hypothetical protein
METITVVENEFRILLWNTAGNEQALKVLLEEARYDLLAV